MEKEVTEFILAKAKVLTATPDGPLWGEGKSKKSYQVLLQDTADESKIYTALCFSDPLPENVKPGAFLENQTIQKEVSGDRTQYRVRFGEKKSGGYGGKGGYAPPAKEDPILKITTMGFAYARDLYLASNPEKLNEEEYFVLADATAAAMNQTYKALKG